jgi:hypothetical protein
MCFGLTSSEAVEWRSLGRNLVSKLEVGPLLCGAPELSRLVSGVDSIKKRHGNLIQQPPNLIRLL